MSSLQHARRSKKASLQRVAKAQPDPHPDAPACAGQVNSAANATISPEERYAMIARAAYFRAAGRGFCPGNELDDWLAAQAEVEARISSRS